MTPVLERLPNGARVLVVRLRSMGDCVLSTPGLALLQAHRPDLHIGVVVEDRFGAIYQHHPAVSALLRPRYRDVMAFRPQLTINLHGGTRSALLTAASMARYRAGFAHYRQQFLYNFSIPRAQQVLGVERVVHTAEHVAAAMFFLGVPLGPVPRASLAVEATATALTASRQPEAPYAVVHPFASAPDKAWPADRFVQVGQQLESEGLRVVVIGAGSDEFSPFAAFDCRGGQTLQATKGLLAGATFFLGNDSGPAHVAAAFGVPQVVLFGASDEKVWHPWQVRHQLLKAPGGRMREIDSSAVWQAVKQVLASA